MGELYRLKVPPSLRILTGGDAKIYKYPAKHPEKLPPAAGKGPELCLTNRPRSHHADWIELFLNQATEVLNTEGALNGHDAVYVFCFAGALMKLREALLVACAHNAAEMRPYIRRARMRLNLGQIPSDWEDRLEVFCTKATRRP